MIKISKGDAEFLLSRLQLTSIQKHVLTNTESTDGVINDEVADEIRDLCTDLLDRVGFDANYQPTQDGRRLEALIDKLFVG